MEGQANVEFHFYQQSEGAVFFEIGAGNSDEERFTEVLLFANLTLRCLSNMGNDAYAPKAAELLGYYANQEVFEGMLSGQLETTVQLVDYKGAPGRKCFLCSLVYSDQSTKYDFKLNMKGFSIFGRGDAFYGMNAVYLLMKFLWMRRPNDYRYHSKLCRVAGACGTAQTNGNVRMHDHHVFALVFAKMVFDLAPDSVPPIHVPSQESDEAGQVGFPQQALELADILLYVSRRVAEGLRTEIVCSQRAVPPLEVLNLMTAYFGTSRPANTA